MKWMLVALALCATAALGQACCTPDQWEGMQSQFSGYAGYFHRGLIKVKFCLFIYLFFFNPGSVILSK